MDFSTMVSTSLWPSMQYWVYIHLLYTLIQTSQVAVPCENIISKVIYSESEKYTYKLSSILPHKNSNSQGLCPTTSEEYPLKIYCNLLGLSVCILLQFKPENIFPFQKELAVELGYDKNLVSSSSLQLQKNIREDIQQNYARVDVYYQTLNVKQIQQSPQFKV